MAVVCTRYRARPLKKEKQGLKIKLFHCDIIVPIASIGGPATLPEEGTDIEKGVGEE